MADDTAALVVALSAQLTKFEKDMKGAVDIADKRTKEIEGKFSALNTTINNKLNAVSSQARGNIGFLGDLLSSLGGKGAAAAVAIGVVAGAITFLASKTGEFADKAKLLKEGADTAGLSINQFKQLGSAGKTVGLDFEETSAFFIKFIANLGQLREGQGPLYEALLKVDTGLLRQLSTTKDSAKAVDLLVAAFIKLNNQTDKLDIAKAAGGKAGLAGVRLLDTLGKQGGLTGLEANNPKIDEKQIERAAQLRVEIEAIEKKTKNIWGGMFSDAILTLEKDSATVLLAIAQLVERITAAKERSKATGEAQPASFADRFDALPGGPLRIRTGGTPEVVPAATGAGSPSVELEILRKNLALIGDAITQGEQWKQKRLEIAAAAEKGGLSDGTASRALAAFNLTMKASALATRERLAVATEQQIVDVKLAQLAQDKVKFGLTENEVQRATVVILRESKDAADALTVRQAYLPGLKQLELDARNARKGLDEFATSGVNTVTDGLADIVTGTKSVSDGFRDMANSILRDLARLAIRQAIVGPLANALGSLLGGAGGGVLPGGAVLGQGGIGHNAGGTDNWPGGLSWVGEGGPELMNVPKGAQIIPNNVAMAGGGNSGPINISMSVDLKGANGDETIARMSAAAARAAVAQAVQITNAGMPGRQRRLNLLGT
jgi:hypothetical protein